MKIQFDQKNKEQLQLIAQMGDKNPLVSQAANQAFAQLLAPALSHVYQQSDTTKFFYRDLPYRADDDPSFPLELFSEVQKGYFNVWSQSSPGGLATNDVYQPIEEVKFSTYGLDSAVSILAKYARLTRLPVLSKALERLMQEVLIKTNVTAWSVVLAALAQARHTINGASQGHVLQSTTSGSFTLNDYNKLMTFFRRLNASWVGGTPTNGASRPTDIIVSPEIMEQFRAMAYNPINTTGPNGLALSTTNAGSASTVALPEAQRGALFQSGGVPSFYGINILELLELGKSQDYQVLFSQYMGSTTYGKVTTPTTLDQTFDSAADELIIVMDATKDFAYRAIATDADKGTVFSLEPDDQFVKRTGKIGWWGGIEEGRLVLDTRAIAALTV